MPTDKELFEALQAPFPESEVMFRLFAKSKDKSKGKFVPYLRKDSIVRRLNEVFGPFGWANHIQPAAEPTPGVISTITAIVKGERISRSSGDAVFNNKRDEGIGQDFTLASSSTKAFINAAELFGIGAYLYGLETRYIPIDDYGNPLEPVTLASLQRNGGASPSATVPAPTGATSAPKAEAQPNASAAGNLAGVLGLTWNMGKHKGSKIGDIIEENPGYFAWFLENSDICNPATNKYNEKTHKIVVAANAHAQKVKAQSDDSNEQAAAAQVDMLFGTGATNRVAQENPGQPVISGQQALECYQEALMAGLPEPKTERPSDDKEFMAARDNLIKDFSEKFGVKVDFVNRTVSPFTEDTLLKMMAYAGEQQPEPELAGVPF